jgi:hypothetical protein
MKRVLCVAATMLLNACGGSKDTTPAPTPPTPTREAVASVTIDPLSAQLRVAEQFTLRGTVRGTQGSVLTDRPLTWTSEQPGIALVANGLVAAVAPGTTRITASAEGVVGVALITVAQAAVARVVFQPALPTDMVVGDAITATVVALDSAGRVIEGRTVTLNSTNPTVLTVSGTRLTAVSPGTAVVTATVDGRTVIAPITVSRPSVASLTLGDSSLTLTERATARLTVVVRDSRGQILTDRLVSFSSSNPTVATVATDGTITSRAPGTATVVVSCEGASRTVRLLVNARSAASLRLNFTTGTVRDGETLDLVATVLDSVGEPITTRLPRFSSTNESIASVNATGSVLGVSPGRTEIRVTIDNLTATASISVTAQPIASVVVTPGTASILVQESVQYTAVVRDAIGRVVSGRTVSWGSSNNNVAPISGAGLVRGLAVGDVTITGTVDGISGASTLSVRPPPTAQVRVTNQLVYPISVTFNSSATRTVNPGSFTEIELPTQTDGVNVTWTLQRPTLNGQLLGEPLNGSFSVGVGARGLQTLEVTNVVNGTTYFVPYFRSLTNAALSIEPRFFANACNCTVQAGLDPVAYGYWRLDPQTVIRWQILSNAPQFFSPTRENIQSPSGRLNVNF